MAWHSLKGYKPEVPDTGLVSGAKNLARNVVSAGVHGAEKAVGLLGDIPAALVGIPELIQQQITGKPSKPGTDVYNYAKKALPTTENIRKGITRPILNRILPEGTLEPQGSGEKGWIDFAETLAGALSPVGGIIHPILGGVKLGTAFLPAALGQLSKWGAEYLGAGEGTQEAVKTGVMLTTALGGNFGTDALFKRGEKLYEQGKKSIEQALSGSTGKIKSAGNAIPKRIPKVPAYGTKPTAADKFKDTGLGSNKYKLEPNRLKVPGLEHDIEEALGMVNRINPQAHGAPEKEAINFLQGLKSDIRGYDNTISLEKIFPYKKLLNRLYYEGTPAQNSAFSEYLSPVKTGLKNVMGKYQKRVPAFKDFLEADQLYAAAHGAQQALGYAQKAINPSSVSSSTTALLLGLIAPIAKPFGLAYTGVKAAIGGTQGLKAAYNAVDILRKTPAVRKHWQDAMSAALRQNATQLNKAVKKLDDAIIKEEGKESSKWKPLVKV